MNSNFNLTFDVVHAATNKWCANRIDIRLINLSPIFFLAFANKPLAVENM